MASIPPGDVATQPNAKIVFNAPYDDKHTYHIKVINDGGRRIDYTIKTANIPPRCSTPRTRRCSPSAVMRSTSPPRTPRTTA